MGSMQLISRITDKQAKYHLHRNHIDRKKKTYCFVVAPVITMPGPTLGQNSFLATYWRISNVLKKTSGKSGAA